MWKEPLMFFLGKVVYKLKCVPKENDLFMFKILPYFWCLKPHFLTFNSVAQNQQGHGAKLYLTFQPNHLVVDKFLSVNPRIDWYCIIPDSWLGDKY